MSPEILPEDVASRSFSHSLRGYDPNEVRAYLESVGDQFRRLRGQYLAARQQLGELEDDEFASQIDVATSDIHEVLHAARIASEQIRDRAARQAANTTDLAEEAAIAGRKTSDADAFALRESAWNTSVEMLEQVRAESARLRKQADRDVLAIVGEAEREAHKKLAMSRRDAEVKLRTSRLEAERLVVEARAERDEMMEHATRATEAAQERTRALERRREELMVDLESLRLQREAPPEPVGRRVAETVRLIPAEPSDSRRRPDDDQEVSLPSIRRVPFAGGSESVRIVETPSVADDAFTIDADEVAGEVARLRAADDNMPAAATESVGASDPISEIEEETGTTSVPRDRDRSPDRDLAKAWSATEIRATDSSDDLGSLFKALRVDDDDDGAIPAGTGVRSETADVSLVSEDTPLEELIPAERFTPFEVRDRVLLPITNRALRDVKRQLADVQNLQLDALKGDPSNWQPDRSELETRLAQELTVVQREAFNAGHATGRDMMNTVSSNDRVDAPDGESGPFISALFDEVVLTVQAGREAGQGARDLGTSVSRVYRVWRTDEAERRMRHLAGRAYHNGLLRAFGNAKVAEVRIEVHGSCERCVERGAAGLSVADTDTFPIHDECRCTIVIP